VSIINKTYSTFLAIFPVIILFISVLANSKYNFSYDDNYLSFNISYIIVFFWSLKRPEYLGYGFIFLAGILNDVIQNNPLGICSIEYLSICVLTAFVRRRIILQNLIYDWVFFLISILIVGSINYIILVYIFNIPIVYNGLLLGLFATFLIYPILAKILSWIENIVQASINDKKN
jgi:rod shape-determining protein MreD